MSIAEIIDKSMAKKTFKQPWTDTQEKNISIDHQHHHNSYIYINHSHLGIGFFPVNFIFKLAFKNNNNLSMLTILFVKQNKTKKAL